MAHASKKVVLESKNCYIKIIKKTDTTTVLIRYEEQEIDLKSRELAVVRSSIVALSKVKKELESLKDVQDIQIEVRQEAIKHVNYEFTKLLVTWFNATRAVSI